VLPSDNPDLKQQASMRPGFSDTDAPGEPLTVEESSNQRDQFWSGDSPRVELAPDFVGKRIGKYEIKRIIGNGGHGVVYLARDQTLQRDVALKIPRPEVLANEDRRRRFDDEARTAARLDHPSIVRVYEAELNGAVPYIASAYCPGASLAQWIEQHAEPGDCKESAAFMRELAVAVHYAHEHGVVHRDLKPGNVLLASKTDGETETGSLNAFHPRLTDFGLAQLAEGQLEDTRSSLIVGTPLYMSPEQASDQQSGVGAASDIFSLGAILYHLLTGAPPYAAESYFAVLTRVRDENASPISEVRKDVDRDLATICMKCLQRDPADRYSSCEELAADLDRYLQGEEIKARPLNVWQSASRWSRHKSRIGEATGAMILISITRIVYAAIGLVMVKFSEGLSVTDAEGSEILFTHLLVTTPTEAWLIWASRRNYKRKLSALLYWFTWGFIIAWCVATFFVVADVLPAPLWYQRSPAARVLVFSIIGMLFAAQAACWYFADWSRSSGKDLPAIVGLAKQSTLVAATVFFFATVAYVRVTPKAAPSLKGPVNSISLDGINDYLEVESVGFGESEPFTMEAWVRAEQSRKAIIMQYGPVSIGTVATSGGNRFHIEIANSETELLLVDTEGKFLNGEWVHLAITYDQDRLTCFLNGEPQAFSVNVYEDLEIANQYPIDAMPNPLKLKDVWPGALTFIGSNHGEVHSNAYFFAGDIGEVRLTRSVFYNASFTPSRTLSKSKETVFLFHLDDETRSEFSDDTQQYVAKSIR
jgi:serine/threonine protein kinase